MVHLGCTPRASTGSAKDITLRVHLYSSESDGESHFYRPQRSWAKVIFLHVSVILLTRGWWSGPRRGSNFSGGVSNFSGGGVSPIFWGVSPIFRGGSPNFFFSNFSSFSSNLFFPKMHQTPPPPPRDGQCAAGTHPTGMHSFFFDLCRCCCHFNVKVNWIPQWQ